VDETRPKRTDQLHADTVVRDRLEPVAEELGIEADLDRLTRVGDRERLMRLTDILCLSRNRQLAVFEAKPKR
jgi:hypothetical protein